MKPVYIVYLNKKANLGMIHMIERIVSNGRNTGVMVFPDEVKRVELLSSSNGRISDSQSEDTSSILVESTKQ